MAVYLLRLRMEGSRKYIDWVVADSQQKLSTVVQVWRGMTTS